MMIFVCGIGDIVSSYHAIPALVPFLQIWFRQKNIVWFPSLNAKVGIYILREDPRRYKSYSVKESSRFYLYSEQRRMAPSLWPIEMMRMEKPPKAGLLWMAMIWEVNVVFQMVDMWWWWSHWWWAWRMFWWYAKKYFKGRWHAWSIILSTSLQVLNLWQW